MITKFEIFVLDKDFNGIPFFHTPKKDVKVSVEELNKFLDKNRDDISLVSISESMVCIHYKV